MTPKWVHLNGDDESFAEQTRMNSTADLSSNMPKAFTLFISVNDKCVSYQ